MNLWYVDGLVLDFRGLTYEWGNSIGNVLVAGKDILGRAFPTGVAVSSSCKSAVEGAYPFYAPQGGEQTKWLFNDLESAVSYVKELIESSRDQELTKKSFWRR
jgi:hypothetical protein